MKSVKYGLFSYDTENIGDEVQSLAASRFLPRVDYYFDRDNIDSTEIAKDDDEVRIIMNGWFTHHPENWPPKNPKIHPLLVSMHIEQDALSGAPAKAFLTEESRRFLKKYGPIGARNKPTFDFLEANGVDTYFSGCVTLTLVPEKSVPRRDFVLAVDVSDKVFAEMKKRTNRTIIRLDTYRSPFFTNSEKFLMAKYWLFLYQSAHSVVTTRLHTMLPCLALKTPVFAISGRDPRRYSGLIDLVRHSSEKEFLKDKTIFNLDNPGDNPSDYLKIRKDLERRCSDFTGYDSKRSYLGGGTIQDLYNNPSFAQLFCDGVYASLKYYLSKGDVAHLKELCKANEAKISDLEHTIKKVTGEKREITAEKEVLEKKLEEPGLRLATKLLIRAVKQKIKK